MLNSNKYHRVISVEILKERPISDSNKEDIQGQKRVQYLHRENVISANYRYLYEFSPSDDWRHWPYATGVADTTIVPLENIIY